MRGRRGAAAAGSFPTINVTFWEAREAKNNENCKMTILDYLSNTFAEWEAFLATCHHATIRREGGSPSGSATIPTIEQLCYAKLCYAKLRSAKLSYVKLSLPN